MGYEKDIESIQYPDSLYDHKLVKQPQRLTERSTLRHPFSCLAMNDSETVWLNIRGPLIEFMQEIRKKRLVREHKVLIAERKQSAVEVLRTFKNARLPYTEILPEGPDFCDFEPIKVILEQPADVIVDESSFTDVLPSLPDLMAAWRRDIDLQLVRALQHNGRRGGLSMVHALLFCMGYDGDSFDLDEDDSEDEGPSLNDSESAAKLKLATTVFRCDACSHPFPYSSISSDDDLISTRQPRPLFYPEVLGHRCTTRGSDLHRETIQRLEHYVKNRRKWTARPLRLDLRMQQMAEAVVEAAGMHLTTTTSEDMDNLGAWFACLKCAFPCPGNMAQTKAYGWRDAVGISNFIHAVIFMQSFF